jgi:predicted hotdog family 3-hydroxylacyl-ACP dehydratase
VNDTTEDRDFANIRWQDIPPAELLHHRGDMLLLDEVIAVDKLSAQCAWTTPERSPWHLGGSGDPAWIGIECMAQCVAVHAGALARLQGLPPSMGVLLGTRDYQAQQAFFLPGHRYTVHCSELVLDDNGMGAYKCEIHEGATLLAGAVLTVYRAHNKMDAWLEGPEN